MPQDAVARVLSVMGMITAGFLLFIIMTSIRSPALPNFPSTAAISTRCYEISADLPPAAAYMGYVGFSGRLRLRHRAR
ncbi:hypothetical protein M8494_03785 [Serratia ureilytica]